jgi:epoxide hydrolase
MEDTLWINVDFTSETQVLVVENDRIRSFRIEIAQEVLNDLRQRLKNTRFSYHAEGAKWALGTDIDYLRELVHYWHDAYDWRKHETALNRFAHFRTDVDDIGLHFIHERGKGSNPFPIILTHGYPDSFYRFVKIIPMLTDPVSFGGKPKDSFGCNRNCHGR